MLEFAMGERMYLSERDFLQFIGRDWEFSSKFEDAPTRRGPIKQILFEDIKYAGREERWFGVIPEWSATLTPSGWVLDEQHPPEENKHNAFLYIKTSSILNSMEKDGDAYVLRSEGDWFTHTIYPIGNNIEKPTQ